MEELGKKWQSFRAKVGSFKIRKKVVLKLKVLEKNVKRGIE